MTFRKWVNILTAVLVLLILIFARNDIIHAFELLGKVNLWWLVLIIPIQFLSYYAAGAAAFSYLEQLGELRGVSKLEQPKVALELNFVNHVAPTAGISGATYMAWRLQKLGVSVGRATLAQVVRLVAIFVAFVALMIVGLIAVTIDGSITRVTILAASGLVSVIVFGIIFSMYIIGSKARLERFSHWLDRVLNKHIAKWLKRKELVSFSKIEEFLVDLHEDYLSLKRKPKVLLRPFLWGIVFNFAEIGMFFVAFLSLGAFVNPASILISIGLAGLVGTFMATPGGAGGYEVAMIFFLTSTGVSAGLVGAGIVLTRTILILLTLASGWYFTHQAQKKYGKAPEVIDGTSLD